MIKNMRKILSAFVMGALFAGMVSTEAFAISQPINPGGNQTYVVAPEPESAPEMHPIDVNKIALEELSGVQDGETVRLMYLGGEKTVKKEIFEKIAGRNITVILNMGNVWWIVSGLDVPVGTELKDLNLGVILDEEGTGVDIPAGLVNSVSAEQKSIRMELMHNGPFGFRMNLHLKTKPEYAGMGAALYYYNEAAGTMEQITAGEINADGIVLFPMDHASKYAIAIGASLLPSKAAPAAPEPAAPVQAPPKAVKNAPPKTGENASPRTGENNNILILMALLSVSGVALAFASKKKEHQA